MGMMDDNPTYDPASDAMVLQKHSEITSDPERHAAAHAHLQDEQLQNQKALDASHKQLRGRVRKGLKKAFGPAQAGDKTPFQKAGENSGTPYDNAEGK